MALSRPYVLVLLAAVLSAVTFVSLQSASDNAAAKDDNAAPVVTGAPKTTPAAPPAGKAKTPAAKAAEPAAKPKPKKAAKPDPGVPPRVKRALASGDVVVLFFRQPGADDDAVASAVASLHRVKRVAIFKDRLTRIGRYRRVVANLGITQAPAVVVVGKDEKARLIEGYVDATTLRQQVQDLR